MYNIISKKRRKLENLWWISLSMIFLFYWILFFIVFTRFYCFITFLYLTKKCCYYYHYVCCCYCCFIKNYRIETSYNYNVLGVKWFLQKKIQKIKIANIVLSLYISRYKEWVFFANLLKHLRKYSFFLNLTWIWNMKIG